MESATSSVEDEASVVRLGIRPILDNQGILILFKTRYPLKTISRKASFPGTASDYIKTLKIPRFLSIIIFILFSFNSLISPGSRLFSTR